MTQKLFSEITVNITVNTLEFFQWYTGLNDREKIEEELYSQDAVWSPEYMPAPITKYELHKFLDLEQITIKSYFATTQDVELIFDNDYSVIIADTCPFIADLKF